MPSKIQTFIDKWQGNSAGEMAVAQQHFLELCEALEVPGPSPSDQELLSYRFEMPVEVPDRAGGAPTTGRIDVYKAEHFVWENKQGSESGSRRVGHGRRGTRAWHVAMKRAFAQAVRYARDLDGMAPPFVVVCDVGHHIQVWSDFSGTGRLYDQCRDQRFTYDDLRVSENRDYLRRVLTDPGALDPAVYQDEVSRQVAEDLARIAKSLEEAGHPTPEASQFLMRCIFTMFAEDAFLLPEGYFTKLLAGLEDNPEELPDHLEGLWKLMDEGGFAPGLGRVLKFNGGLFHQSKALPLSGEQVRMLHAAAQHDWAEVEPTIFGTLVERALDPVERHRLGAHFTPRPYIERVVRPAVIEPLRDDWLAVQAAVLEALGEGEPTPRAKKKAQGLLSDFHEELCELRVLDPACGTGNFLYVTYDLLKDLEAEVLRMLVDVGGTQLGLRIKGHAVLPTQMLGIEKSPRAREIADLVLWIGHLQRLRRDGVTENIPEPVLQEAYNIECRDAVLAWDGNPVSRKDVQGKAVRVWDMRSMKTDAVTGLEVPDEACTVVVNDYPGARAATWPGADFVVSNPPFVGNKKMRMALGDGYAEALRAAWPEVPGDVDFVMYWWEHAARLMGAGRLRGFGFITTNSITQVSNRAVIESHLGTDLAVMYAIPDHPWVADGAAVRIAVTVAGKAGSSATLGWVLDEQESADGPAQIEVDGRFVAAIHSNLTAGADIAGAVPLKANQGLSFMGVTLVGKGFAVTPQEIVDLGFSVEAMPPVIRPYCNARDLTRGGTPRFVIDFFGLSDGEAMEQWPGPYQRLLELVKPERAHNKRDSYREKWWVFGEPRGKLRMAVAGVQRFIITPETSKHRIVSMVDAGFCPDHSLYAIALSEGWAMGIMSGRAQRIWSLAAGSRLGVGNDPRWRNGKCFDPFPFPDFTGREGLRDRIATLAERLQTHRGAVQDLGKIAGKQAHLTNQYNALKRARSARAGGEPLTEKERAFHEGALIGILQTIHEELDVAVAEAYGWPVDLPDDELLQRLVDLNLERAEEEAQGLVRWLRPEVQAPAQGVLTQDRSKAKTGSAPASKVQLSWPTDNRSRLVAILHALQGSAGPVSATDLAGRFKGARKSTVATVLTTLESLGVVLCEASGKYTLSL